ncbi:hypothetical protein LWC35_10270 [Pseudonocardia kujensis]|uniref:hypothetical protein n=1 Tax=Pseudonocardia kujensis TaxID=1128675 RepID=UPI001E357195|nr:hypothetical protein [Pseudonocardia kujensis]MCE0763288.1 hypothetical protein [Pseudonocardia kujensis]
MDERYQARSREVDGATAARTPGVVDGELYRRSVREVRASFPAGFHSYVSSAVSARAIPIT